MFDPSQPFERVQPGAPLDQQEVIPPLPPGASLDAPQTLPPLPPGFVLDQPSSTGMFDDLIPLRPQATVGMWFIAGGKVAIFGVALLVIWCVRRAISRLPNQIHVPAIRPLLSISKSAAVWYPRLCFMLLLTLGVYMIASGYQLRGDSNIFVGYCSRSRGCFHPELLAIGVCFLAGAFFAFPRGNKARDAAAADDGLQGTKRQESMSAQERKRREVEEGRYRVLD